MLQVAKVLGCALLDARARRLPPRLELLLLLGQGRPPSALAAPTPFLPLALRMEGPGVAYVCVIV